MIVPDPYEAWEPWPWQLPDAAPTLGPDSTVSDDVTLDELPARFTVRGFARELETEGATGASEQAHDRRAG